MNNLIGSFRLALPMSLVCAVTLMALTPSTFALTCDTDSGLTIAKVACSTSNGAKCVVNYSAAKGVRAKARLNPGDVKTVCMRTGSIAKVKLIDIPGSLATCKIWENSDTYQSGYVNISNNASGGQKATLKCYLYGS